MSTDYDMSHREMFRPLEKLAGPDTDFMFMGRHRGAGPEGEDIYAYKHYFTRNYVHLDAGGNAFDSYAVSLVGDPEDWVVAYVPVDPALALAAAVDDYMSEETP